MAAGAGEAEALPALAPVLLGLPRLPPRAVAVTLEPGEGDPHAARGAGGQGEGDGSSAHAARGTRARGGGAPGVPSWRLCDGAAGNDAATSDREESFMATRTQGTRRPATGRSARSAGTPAKRQVRITRRTPQKTGLAKLLDGVAGGTAKKGASGSGKGRAAGLAMLAGAGRPARQNRRKLEGMVRRKGSGTGDRTAHADAPAHPVVITEEPAANANASASAGAPPPAA